LAGITRANVRSPGFQRHRADFVIAHQPLRLIDARAPLPGGDRLNSIQHRTKFLDSVGNLGRLRVG
jgi:hypothetical protein